MRNVLETHKIHQTIYYILFFVLPEDFNDMLLFTIGTCGFIKNPTSDTPKIFCGDTDERTTIVI